jgi:NAD(P)-dependent dehydrogenase (short-subunit alcohol dehydrogenase family)
MVAVVTGAGSGLGRAVAHAFAREGAAVMCVDIDETSGADCSSSIQAGGGTSRSSVADVTSEADQSAMVEATLTAFGRVDILFANAGINIPGKAHETELEAWNAVLSVDLTGVWLTARAVLPTMIRQGSGSIICNASTAGLIGELGDAPYSAAKGGVIALARQMAAEYGPSGIRVNSMCPSFVLTPFAEGVLMERDAKAGVDDREPLSDRLRRTAQRFPLRRIGDPDDVAHLAVFLASAESGWITGAAIPVDGGLSSAARFRS